MIQDFSEMLLEPDLETITGLTGCQCEEGLCRS